MGLRQYRQKRDFSKTPEPAGGETQPGGARPAYVVQMHQARRLHFDFRLELDGVLKSWAVPKGPSLDPGEKRLAVHVEDHPVEYGGFEGVIPKGEYGGGTVMIWDRGSWEPVGDAAQGYAKGNLKFMLHGQKLRGKWALVRMKPREGDKGDNWLLLKERDGEARPGSGEAVVAEETLSALTGRDLAAIAKEADRVWHSKGGGEAAVERTPLPAAPDPAAIPGAKRAKAIPHLVPQLATSAERAPIGDDWLHEIKYNGYRILAEVAHGKVKLKSRNDLDWTRKFPELAKALANLPAEAALLDGEVAHLGENGVSSFSGLQADLAEGRTQGLAYIVFDLLHFDGWDLAGAKLEDRKRALQALVARAEIPCLRYGDHQIGRGPEFYAAAARFGLEGIVAKRRDAVYRSGRTTTWLKIKCTESEEVVIVGFTEPEGTRAGFGALLMAYHLRDGTLVYGGRVGTGFSDKVLAALRKRLEAIEQKRPTVKLPEGLSAKGTHWVKPELVAEVRFGDWTRDGILRHARFVGLREDKAASDVILTPPAEGRPSAPAAPAPAASKVGRDGAAVVAGVRVTHAEKLMYPEAGITKLGLAEYYAAVADWALPYVARRPLSLVRCPDGVAGEHFYQKHLGAGVPAAIRQVPIAGKDGSEAHPMIESGEGLVALAQLGVLEIHPWGSTIERPDKPDRLIFDLDPDEGLDWRRVVAAALAVRDALERLGLQSFAKTTGGKGLHVVLPIRPTLDWDEAKDFTRALAERLASDEPHLYTATMAKRRRSGRIFIDFFRNARGATAVGAYSTRARTQATVSAPLTWAEVESGIRSDQFTLSNLPQRLASLAADPWAEFWDAKQAITAAARRAVAAG